MEVVRNDPYMSGELLIAYGHDYAELFQARRESRTIGMNLTLGKATKEEYDRVESVRQRLEVDFVKKWGVFAL